MDQDIATPDSSGAPAAMTVSHLLGEMAWLLTQSPLHRGFSIGDLEWLVMPPLIHRQFYTFRDGERPVGLALWAKCTPEAEAKLERGMTEPENRLSLEDWNNGGTVWLVDLIAPFADGDNRQRETMIANLVSGPLAGTEFRFHETDPQTGERSLRIVEADARAKLTQAVEAARE